MGKVLYEDKNTKMIWEKNEDWVPVSWIGQDKVCGYIHKSEIDKGGENERD